MIRGLAIIRRGWLMYAMLAFLFPGSPSASLAETITIPGTGASQEMLRAIAKEFMAEHPGATIDIPDSTGSGGGIRAVAEGNGDMGRVSRKLKPKEVALGLEYLAFARLPIVFVANPSVPVLNLTTAQTRDIFAGKTVNWKAAGGPDARIRVLTRYEGDATIGEIRSVLDGWRDLQVTPYSVSSDTDQENVEAIARTRDAIGFCNLAQALGAALTVMKLDGLLPADAQYPLYIEQAVVYKPDKMTRTAKSFLDYLFGPKAQAIMKRAGATPLMR